MFTPAQFTQGQSLQLSQLFPAKRERVYRAWTNKEALEGWFGPEGFRTTVLQLDLAVGGDYRFEMQGPEGNASVVKGRYMEIVPNEKLVFTWRWEDWDDQIDDSLVTVEFREKGEFTEVALTHQNLRDEEAVAAHTFGWTNSLEASLAKFLA
jgi:uncharacterized protein YndB with AHSA1/START domain